MAKLFWKSEYNVNSRYIDQQHQHLLAIVNDFNEAITAGKGKQAAYPILNRLVQYAEEHFRDEEKLMRMARYPQNELNSHINDHEKLTEEIFQHTENWSNYGEEALPRIGEFLKKWLMDHILTADKKYSKYVVNIDDKYLSVK
ncbi:MAG: bacteriohemerythrin [Pseudomonadota bacterium]